MNAVIETINSAGQAFVEFMLPMFIQSSVLILILFLLDVLLRRRVRAVFRYWIWMLVLVKLVLPPSLCTPVSIGTWLGETLEPPHIAVDEPLAPQPQMPPAEWQPQAKLGDGTPVVMTHTHQMQTSAPEMPGVAAASDSLPMETPAPMPTPEGALSGPDTRSLPAPALRWPAVVLLVWLAIMSALLLLLLQRAWFVRGLVAQAQEAPPRLQAALDQCRTRVGVAKPIPLRLSPNATSPAVCGLLRPVILVPQNLAPRLLPHDLQAVLLHELAHVKRGDLWVNLIQTLLQIVHFYNPLLWLANAMIRRVREQAVDEAVLVAMGETAPDYPETLLHIAKLAFHRRPALSLRLIGVVESKSALRSRIKHILARPLPKTARLGLLGLLAVCLIAALLLPMARASEETVSVVNNGPLDIRLIGVCPDGDGELYDANGKKLNVTMPPLGTSERPWDSNEVRRDFVFEVPDVDEKLVFDSYSHVRPAHADKAVGGGSIKFDPLTDPSRLVLSAEFDRTYPERQGEKAPQDLPVRKVDLTLKYFLGPRGEALCTFTGPFTGGTTVQADDGCPYELTLELTRSSMESLLEFYLTTNQPVERDVPVILYDINGMRYAAFYIGSREGRLRYHVDAVRWNRVAAITVGEQPYEITFQNVVVDYPRHSQRTYPEHLDRVAERLNLTAWSPDDLIQYNLRHLPDIVAVLDVIRSSDLIGKVTEAFYSDSPRLDFTGLDPAIQERIRATAASWVDSPHRTDGIILGLAGHWPEFFDLAIERLQGDCPALPHYPERETIWRLHSHMIAHVLEKRWGLLNASEVQKLKDCIRKTTDGWVLISLFECLEATSSPEATTTLRELAQDEHPWIWWRATEMWCERVSRSDWADDNLPEEMKLRLYLVEDHPVDADVKAKARALLAEQLTPQLTLMSHSVWLASNTRILQQFDRTTVTRIYVDYLRRMRSLIAGRELYVPISARVSLDVAQVVRSLNLWYDVNIGNLGTSWTQRPYGDKQPTHAVLDSVISDVLTWYAANPDRVPRELPLEGQVVDEAGHPIVDAQVTLKRLEDRRTGSGYTFYRYIEVDTCRTDADGRFTFTGLGTHPSYTLDVVAAGFMPRGFPMVGRQLDGRYGLLGGSIIKMRKSDFAGGSVSGGFTPRTSAFLDSVKAVWGLLFEGDAAVEQLGEGLIGLPLTDRARSVMSLADEEARRLNHDYVGTEHILLALAHQEDAVSAKVLANLGADLDTLRTEVNKFVQPGTEPVTRSTLPRMPRAERAMQYAKEEAKSLGHDYIGTEHILLALLRDKEGVAAQALAGLGITETQVRAQVLTFVQPGRQDPQDNNDEGAGGGALVEPHPVESPGVTAKLPNGVTVEFLAYSRLTAEGLKWWMPDGRPASVPGVYEADVQGLGTVLAFRTEPEVEMLSVWSYQPPNRETKLEKKRHLDGSGVWLVSLGEQGTFINIEMQAIIADPPVLAPIACSASDARIYVGIDEYGILRIGNLEAVDEDRLCFKVDTGLGHPQTVAVLDEAGKLHSVRKLAPPPYGQYDGPGRLGVRLKADLPADQFAGILVEGQATRGGRVRIRNLSLDPDRLTQPLVEIVPSQQGPWWRASKRFTLFQVLAQSLTGYAKFHNGRYPDSLSDLDRSGEEPIDRQAAYLGSGKELTDNPPTVITYEKTLLSSGCGTYVAYSDGDIQFNTPAELEQLGITQANRTVHRRTAASEPVNQTKADAVVLPAVKAELPNGVTVEFLAYSQLVPRGGLFWFDPQGQETTIPGVYEADVDGLGTILALRVQPPEAHLVAQLYRGPDSQNIEKQWQLAGTSIWLLPLGDERNFANLRIITELPMPAVIEAIPLTEENLGQLVEVNRCGIASIVDLQAVMGEPPMLQFSYIRAAGCSQAVVAFLDKEGRTHPIRMGSADGYRGILSPNRLAGIVVEAAPVHTADVRLRNISLTPERVTEIQIEPAAKQGVLWRLSYRHLVLESLTNSLLGFRERHGGRFPASLADLQSSHDPDAFRWITTHIAYVGQDKSPDDDPRSVIAYDKTLLAEGRGTYVLYSDGQLEFESPVELAELGLLAPNQGGIPPDSANRSSGDGVGSNATGKPRFTVQGVVTDASGRPMEGVWVNVDCGFERPQRAGRTLTDEDGRYTLGFESAWVVADADPYGVGIQPAFVYARKDGFYETSLCHKGNLAMAGKAPGPAEQRFVAGRAGVVLVNEPYELNFVMAPAALLTGQLVDANGRPMANHDLWLFSGQMYPPHQRSISIRTGSDGTFGPYTLPCTSVRFHGAQAPLARSYEIAFTRAGNWRVTLKYRQTGSQTAQLLVEDLQGPTDKPSNSVSTAPQPTAAGLSGRVVDPNGAPAAGAQVAWIDAKRSVSITDGRLMAPRFGDRGKGPIVETDERGYFRFEEEPNDGFSLVAAHDAGFALIGSEQFARDRMIRLEPLGRVEGRVAQGRKPAGDKIWMGGLPNSTWFKHRRDYRYETLCDSEGRFTFKRVPPGWFEVGYLIDNGDSSASFTSRTPVVVEPGETATVTLGGEGRPVIGRFVPPPDWEGPIYFGTGLRSMDTVHPERPRPDDYSQMTQRQQQEWIKQWHQTPEAEEYLKAVWHDRNRRHYTFCIADDGTFRIKDVIPGKYKFTVGLEDPLSGGWPEEFGGYSGTIEVPPMDEAYSDDPLDVGDLVLRLRRPLHVGDTAPSFEAQTIDGKAIRLADYRGRFVLLNLWSPVFNPEVDRLKELHATYGPTGQLQIIGLGGTDTLDEVKEYVAEHDIEWPEIYFGPDWDAELLKQLGGQMQILLIDPDGKIVATWLRGEKLTDTVREAVEKADLGLSGRVVGPNGEPVAGATVAIYAVQASTEIQKSLPDLKAAEQVLFREKVQTDVQGRFWLKTDPAEGSVLVAFHRTGMLMMSCKAFKESHTLQLAPWPPPEDSKIVAR